MLIRAAQRGGRVAGRAVKCGAGIGDVAVDEVIGEVGL